MTERLAALRDLETAVRAWQNNDTPAEQFCSAWRRALTDGGFSPRAHEVSEGLLVRVESAAAFGGGESCSFSASEMQDAFAQLLEKLRTAK